MTSLETEALRLEPLLAAHADEMYGPLQDERIYTLIPDEPPALDALRRRYSFLESGKSKDGREDWLNWVVYKKDEAGPIGTVQASVRPGVDADIAYILFPPFWGKGHGRDATRAMIGHVLARYDVKTIEAKIDTRNRRSIAMVEGIGLRRIRTIEGADHFKGHSSDEHVYRIDAADWPA